MAEMYVRTDGSNTSPYDTWAKAGEITEIFTAASGGDIAYIADGYTYTQAAGSDLTLDGPTSGAPLILYGVNDTSDPEPPTAVVSAQDVTHPVIETSTNSRRFFLYGRVVAEGIEFKSGWDFRLGAVSSDNTVQQYRNCIFNQAGASGAYTIQISGRFSANPYWFSFESCEFQFASTAQSMVLQGSLMRFYDCTWDDNLTNVFSNPSFCQAEFYACTFASTGNLIATTSDPYYIKFEKCNVGSGITWISGTKYPGQVLIIHSCDDSTGNSVARFYESWGDLGVAEDDTSIYITGDGDNVTDWSIKFTTTANTNILNPLRVCVGKVAADFSSARTIDVPIVHDDATGATDLEMWIEVEHIDDNTTQGLWESGRNSNSLDSTPTTHGSSSETWNGTGGFSNENKQDLSVTTASTGRNKQSAANVYVCIAEASKTLYSGAPRIT